MVTPILSLMRTPTGRHWELGPLPPPSGDVVLIGWRAAGDGDEAGMPRRVAGLLATAMTAIARVTFPSTVPPVSAQPGDPTGDGVRTVTISGAVERWRLRWSRRPTTITLVSSTDATIARQLFDDAGYPWWLGQQVALLSASDAPPPEVDAATILALFDDDWATCGARLADHGVDGVIRAGVDGDVLGMLTFDQGYQAAVIAAVQHAATAAGFAWA